jgi:hypothetical protein
VERAVRVQDRNPTVHREKAISEAPLLCQQFTYFRRNAIVIVTELIVNFCGKDARGMDADAILAGR